MIEEYSKSLSFLMARMQSVDVEQPAPGTELHNCSFRLSSEELEAVDFIARKTSMSRSRTMILLMNIGIDVLFSKLPMNVLCPEEDEEKK